MTERRVVLADPWPEIRSYWLPTQIPEDFFDRLPTLSGAEVKVLISLYRTAPFALTTSQLMAATGLSKADGQQVLTNLANREIILSQMRPGEEALYAVGYGADPHDPGWAPGSSDLMPAANAPKPWAPGDSEWVYFIQAGEGGPIKIGVARNPSRRLHALRTGAHAPLTLLGAVRGGYDFEARLHEEFREQHRHGEWFDPTPILLDRIAELTGVS